MSQTSMTVYLNCCILRKLNNSLDFILVKFLGNFLKKKKGQFTSFNIKFKLIVNIYD